MMELIFNELSTQPFADDFTGCYERIGQFIKTYKVAELHGFKRIRFQQPFDNIMLQSDYSMNNFMNDSRARTFANLLLGIYRYPFIDDDSEEEDRYIQNNFFILKDGQKIPVHGLAAVYLYQTIGIGFCSEPFWENLIFSLQIEGDENRIETILSVSCPDHFEKQAFIEWKEKIDTVQLIEYDIVNKKISLRDDHGKNILLPIANRLVKSPYVIEVVNSLPYNPNERNFIRKIKPDGLIEIVLTKTDKGFGLVVKTTGRNKKETETIAELLKQEFEA